MASSNSVEFDFHQEEVSLEVPKDLTQFSLGFAIDAGGSVTKLVYRSKKDYTNGKLNEHVDPSVGILRLRYFRSGDDEVLVNFIRDNCDIMDSAMEGDVWFHTGVQTQHFKEMLEEVGKRKIQIMSEPAAAHQGLIGFYSCVTDLRSNWLSTQAVGRALSSALEFLGMMQKSKDIGNETFEFSKDVNPAVVEEHVTKIMTTDAETLTNELMSTANIEWPCVLAIFGSAAAICIMHEDGKYDFGNFSVVSGKTFLGLGKQLCGAKDFDDLIEMASRGDHTKVNTMSGDMKRRDRKEEDWYSFMPENFVIFALGKLADDAYAGTYTKDDLAAGLLHTICSVVAKVAVSVARLSKVNCVVISGSLGSRKVAREALQEYALADTLLQPLSGEDPIKWVFIPHPGFICALGVWYRNLKIENGRRTQ